MPGKLNMRVGIVGNKELPQLQAVHGGMRGRQQQEEIHATERQ